MPDRAPALAGGLLAATAVVLWVLSLTGRWELGAARSGAWAVGGSVVLAAVAAGAVRRRATTLVGVAGTVGCAVVAALVWRHAGRQTWPQGASALGFVAQVAGAATGVILLLSSRRGRWWSAAAVAPVAVVIAAAVATIGWDARPVGGHVAAGPLRSGPDPGPLTRPAWSLALTSSTVAGAGAGGVYVVANPGPRAQVDALDPADGHLRWSWSRPSFDAAPSVVTGGDVVVVSLDGGTAVLDAGTGRERATFATPASVVPPTVTGDQVVFVGPHSDVSSYSTATGALLWSRSLSAAACDGPASLAAITAVPGDPSSAALAYACTQPPSLRVAWAGPSGSHLPSGVAAVSTSGTAPPGSACLRPAGDGLVGDFLTGTGQTVDELAVDPASGRVRWSTQPSDDPDAPVDQTSCLILAARPGGLVAPVAAGQWGLVDAADGDVRSQFPVGAISTDVLYSAVDGGWIYEVLSPETGVLSAPPVLRSVDLSSGTTGAQLSLPIGTRVQVIEPTPGAAVVITNVGSLNMPATQILTGYR